MKTLNLSDIRRRNTERRAEAIRAVRRVNPDFNPGDRAFDRPRKNPHKQRILDEMKEREEFMKLAKEIVIDEDGLHVIDGELTITLCKENEHNHECPCGGECFGC